MKILDATLRDGGFVNDFNWDMEFARKYYDLMSKFKIHYIELGYWKQTKKSKNPFYNMGINEVDKITKNAVSENACIIVDYHYCTKDLKSYPTKNQTPISMIRITSRKEDIDRAIIFANKLRDKTELDISLQVINVTNYSKKELENATNKLVHNELAFVYFADSHGNLNLIEDYSKHENFIYKIKDYGINFGYHLHNNTGRALLNYFFMKEKKIDITDTSILGLGKGGGNLKLEEVIINENFVELLEFVKNNKKHLNLKNDAILYNMISGRTNVTSNYAQYAIKEKMSLNDFYIKCLKLRSHARDNFDSKFLL